MSVLITTSLRRPKLAGSHTGRPTMRSQMYDEGIEFRHYFEVNGYATSTSAW